MGCCPRCRAAPGTGRYTGRWPPGQPRVGGAEQAVGVPVVVVAEAAQISDGGGGDWLLAVAAVGDIAGQGEPGALGHLGRERLAGDGRWWWQGPLPGVGAL